MHQRENEVLITKKGLEPLSISMNNTLGRMLNNSGYEKVRDLRFSALERGETSLYGNMKENDITSELRGRLGRENFSRSPKHPNST